MLYYSRFNEVLVREPHPSGFVEWFEHVPLATNNKIVNARKVVGTHRNYLCFLEEKLECCELFVKSGRVLYRLRWFTDKNGAVIAWKENASDGLCDDPDENVILSKDMPEYLFHVMVGITRSEVILVLVNLGIKFLGKKTLLRTD